jgi:GNAT superfamily N-acetyltransferase
MTIEITLRPAGSGQACAAILADLSAWFGQPESNANYARVADEGPAWIALEDGHPVAIMTLKDHFDTAVEIYLLGVRPPSHHQGLGRALIERAEAYAAERGAIYLTVKTLGPSEDYEPYARTRAFYRAVGFTPLEEFTDLWADSENPCLFLVKPVKAALANEKGRAA